MHRRETVEIFRTRLVEVIEQSGMSRSEFARRIRADRSTLSQLLASDGLAAVHGPAPVGGE